MKGSHLGLARDGQSPGDAVTGGAVAVVEARRHRAGAVVLAIMHTWKTGRTEIFRRVYGNNVTESELTEIARSKYVTRVSGGAVFMAGAPAMPAAAKEAMATGGVIDDSIPQ